MTGQSITAGSGCASGELGLSTPSRNVLPARIFKLHLSLVIRRHCDREAAVPASRQIAGRSGYRNWTGIRPCRLRTEDNRPRPVAVEGIRALLLGSVLQPLRF